VQTENSNAIMVVIGTRLEAIKMAPVVRALRARFPGRTLLCSSGQHREMLDQVLDVFSLRPDIDLNVMKPGQDLSELTARILTGVRSAIREYRPNAVLVHGDTTTCLAGSLAAFYEQVPIGHVEAGLRTYNFDHPWPEEMNRRLVDPISTWCFAPTEQARANLLAEKVPSDRIHITGNTAIDALLLTLDRQREDPAEVTGLDMDRLSDRRTVLVTGHRRESFGEGLKNICWALRDIAAAVPDVDVVYPVHLNPRVQQPVNSILGDQPRVHLLPPQPYPAFVRLMGLSHLIITDSGGIQEEAPSLGKPVLVTRETTERPEAMQAGVARLVGAKRQCIVDTAVELLEQEHAYRAMARAKNPYGDGNAAVRIAEVLKGEALGDSSVSRAATPTMRRQAA